MRKLTEILILLTAAGTLYAQQTRTERANPTTPADDAKANSDKVPEVYAIQGSFKQVLTLRFKFKADLLAGIEKMVKEHKIKNAVILSAIGSVRNWHVHQVSNRDFPSKNMFVMDLSEPADIAGMNGYVIDGRVHAHITLSTPDKAFGGHLEPGTNVFTFAIISLGIMADGADFAHLDDKSYR